MFVHLGDGASVFWIAREILVEVGIGQIALQLSLLITKQPEQFLGFPSRNYHRQQGRGQIGFPNLIVFFYIFDRRGWKFPSKPFWSIGPDGKRRHRRSEGITMKKSMKNR
jgi:hypothetical protein